MKCLDVAIPIEIIFDRNIGDLFSIRVIGNICRDSQLGSIEFGVRHLGTRLCVVLGHTRCGAVTAACTEMDLEKNIRSLMQSLEPAIERAKASTGKTGAGMIETCCIENIFVQIETMYEKSEILRHAAHAGDLLIVGAVYDIESGQVTFLGPHPGNAFLTAEISERNG